MDQTLSSSDADQKALLALFAYYDNKNEALALQTNEDTAAMEGVRALVELLCLYSSLSPLGDTSENSTVGGAIDATPTEEASFFPREQWLAYIGDTLSLSALSTETAQELHNNLLKESLEKALTQVSIIDKGREIATLIEGKPRNIWGILTHELPYMDDIIATSVDATCMEYMSVHATLT